MRHELLSSNAKLAKAVKLWGNEIIAYGLSLAPHRRSGFNVCSNAGVCSTVCNLWFSGRIRYESVRQTMVRRTRMLFERPAEFYAALDRDLGRVDRRAAREGKVAYVRLNVASDLDWMRVIEKWGRIRFYDYTKIKSRADLAAAGKLPANYWLTPSWSERMHVNSARAYLRKGLNVSVVFDTEYVPNWGKVGKLPKRWKGYRVIDGDVHDLRHRDYDGEGNVIGLRFKGGRKLMAHAMAKGFVVST
jgi:hypothetical protein